MSNTGFYHNEFYNQLTIFIDLLTIFRSFSQYPLFFSLHMIYNRGYRGSYEICVHLIYRLREELMKEVCREFDTCNRRFTIQRLEKP